MGFGREDKVVNVDEQVGFVGEQEVQVLDGLRQKVRVHSVFMLAGADVIDGSVATRDASVLLKRFQDLKVFKKIKKS